MLAQHGKWHREDDKPAIVYANGRREWYVNGKLHREHDKPAVIYGVNNCHREWRWNGKLHRDGDLPAFIDLKTQEWYRHGNMHRDSDLPAFISVGGDKAWYKNNRLHRDGDKPAIIYGNNKIKLWYKHGKKISDRQTIVLLQRSLNERNDIRKRIFHSLRFCAVNDTSYVICQSFL